MYVLQSRASRSRCSIPGISGWVDLLTSPAPAARAAFATGAWVESKHDMYPIHTWKCGSLSFIFTHPPEDEKRKKRKAYLVPGAVHAGTQQTIQIRGTGVSCAYKLLVSRDYLIARTCYKQSNAFLLRRRRRRSAVSPWNVDPLRSTTHSAWNPQCTQWFRAEEFPLLPLPYTESHATLQSR